MRAIWKTRETTLMSGTWFGLSGRSQKKERKGKPIILVQVKPGLEMRY